MINVQKINIIQNNNIKNNKKVKLLLQKIELPFNIPITSLPRYNHINNQHKQSNDSQNSSK